MIEGSDNPQQVFESTRSRDQYQWCSSVVIHTLLSASRSSSSASSTFSCAVSTNSWAFLIPLSHRSFSDANSHYAYQHLHEPIYPEPINSSLIYHAKWYDPLQGPMIQSISICLPHITIYKHTCLVKDKVSSYKRLTAWLGLQLTLDRQVLVWH